MCNTPHETTEKEEELEALRIQKRRMESMHDADFLVDSFSQKLAAAASSTARGKGERRPESTLLDSEKLRLLNSRAPELASLLREFNERTAQVEALKQSLPHKSEADQLKYRIFFYILSHRPI